VEGGAGSSDGSDDGEGATDSEAGEPSGEAETSARSGAPGGKAGRDARGPVPPDVGDGANDDVVAQQLRELAENETDPELREAYWCDYRKYKGLAQDCAGSDAER
jgi:hypothetical protein